jgi:hypothetical protein
LNKPVQEERVSGAVPLSMSRLALLILGPLLLFLLVAFAIAFAVLREYRAGGTEPASEGFFWIAAVAIPLSLLLATWLLPRRLPHSQRQIDVDTSGEVVSMAFYDDVRVLIAWFCCVVIAAASLAGLVGSALALNDCAGYYGTCGTVVHHRLVIYGLVAAVGEVLALAGVRLLARAPLVAAKQTGESAGG